MIRKYILFLTAALLLLVVTGCGRTVEKQSDKAMVAARDAFEMNRKKSTETLDDVKFYKPVGWKVDMMKEERTILFSKRSQILTAEFNPNAKSDSRAYYELLMADSNKKFIDQQTYTDTGVFGFAAISDHGESSVEVITGAGQAQVTAIVPKEDLTTTIERMMEIARSLHVES
ncbi:hypothetical protein [Sporosarcina sp. A2]|uniref:hypothetical protein n=1 Tax=Sporosarcina sp. A2 TaxID=3393449 RepID=UPI003D78C1D2